MASSSDTPRPTTDDDLAQKVSVSMPASRVAAVRARTGARGFSAYVSAAVERQLQRDLLAELVEDVEDRVGAEITPEMRAEADAVLNAAEDLYREELDQQAGKGLWRGTEAA